MGAQSGSRIYQFVGGGFMEFDTEFKFAKIQNSHLWGGGGGNGGGGSQNLMPSSNLLKTKIPIGGGVGVGVGGGFQLLMLSLNLLKKKKKKFFCEKFSKFSGKNWNGFVLGFEYRVVRYTKYSEPQ